MGRELKIETEDKGVLKGRSLPSIHECDIVNPGPSASLYGPLPL